MSLANLPSNLGQSISAFNKNYAGGNPAYFDAFDDNATIFVIESSQLFVGREAYKENFETTLSGTRRELHVLDSQATMPNDKSAIVTQLLEIKTSGDPIAVFVRESQIWNKEDTLWKIVHLHDARIETSLTVQAIAPISPKIADSVRVLNARIATTAVQAGVAQ